MAPLPKRMGQPRPPRVSPNQQLLTEDVLGHVGVLSCPDTGGFVRSEVCVVFIVVFQLFCKSFKIKAGESKRKKKEIFKQLRSNRLFKDINFQL